MPLPYVLYIVGFVLTWVIVLFFFKRSQDKLVEAVENRNKIFLEALEKRNKMIADNY